MVDSSPLSDVLTTDGAARITHNLIAARIISSDARYMTPMQIGGLWSPHTVFAAAGYNREAAHAMCAPIAALTLKADRDAAIAELDERLRAAAHTLVGHMRQNAQGGGGHPNQEIHFLMVRALACLGLVLGLGWAHPNPNPNAHPNPNPNPNQVDEKLMCYSCTHTAAAWKLATLLNEPTCDAAG